MHEFPIGSSNRRLTIAKRSDGKALFDVYRDGPGIGNRVVCSDVTREQAEDIISALREVFPEPEPKPIPEPFKTAGSAGTPLMASIDRGGSSGGALPYITLHMGVAKEAAYFGGRERYPELASLSPEKATLLRDWLTEAIDFLASVE